jgi:hypothetical protein
MNTVFNFLINSFQQPPVFGPIVFALFSWATLYISHPVHSKFKRSKSGFGTVFDAISGKGIDLARIRLVDLHGLTVASAVTDKYGHYRLSGIPGEFTVDVLKPGYHFPSVFLKAASRSKMYDNVISSQKIKIKDYGIITKNIPLDQIGETRRRSKVFSRWIVISDNIQFAISYLSLFCILYPLFAPTHIGAWIILMVHCSIVGDRIMNFRPAKPQFGTVTDTDTREPIDRAIIRLYDASFNKILNTQVTSPKGRYAFLVNQGSYYMTLQKEGYKSIRLNIPNITKDSYPLATDVRMKKI